MTTTKTNAGAAAKAAEELRARWDEWVDCGGHRVDIGAKLEAALAGLVSHAAPDTDTEQERLGAVMAAVRERMARPNVGGGDLSRVLCRNQLGQIEGLIDVLVNGKPERSAGELAAEAAIEEARQDLRESEAEAQDARERLEEAVARLDVEAVTSLRPRVEIELPKQVGAARLALLDAERAAARAAAGPADQACKQAQAAAEQARRVVEDLEEKLGRARAELATADARQARAAGAAQQLERKVEALTEQRRELEAELQAQQEAAFRSLAGLPDTAPPPAHVERADPAEAPRSLIVNTPVQTGR